MQTLSSDIHDPNLRPKLLGSLLLKVPADGKVNLSTVHYIGETLVRHHLLQQDAAVAASGAGSVVDAWFERLLSLLSSPKMDARWVALVLLGVSFSDVSTGRFLASYATWFNKVSSLCMAAPA
eukprot:CAMPEP_0198222034 /NCGR_PEP_ID=MMETSP1445-20131203/86342_1 /TAXON_ID=36898 /ORGANISM="Pyramimonas sp., Strain CCMP2087" /LENGTH=122 /DNA_ID=CAMNT_0043900387 /DNA_START=142 /DNA_END=507 /DNA_ORIENTATION=-